MLESVLAELVEAIKANTAVTAQLLAGRVTADTTPTEAKPAKAKAKEVAPPAAATPEAKPAAKPAAAPLTVVDPEPEAQPEADTPDPDLDGPTEVVETEVVVTDADLRAAIQPKLASGGLRFKEEFRALRAEYGIAGISELTDANRGEFLTRIQAL